MFNRENEQPYGCQLQTETIVLSYSNNNIQMSRRDQNFKKIFLLFQTLRKLFLITAFHG